MPDRCDAILYIPAKFLSSLRKDKNFLAQFEDVANDHSIDIDDLDESLPFHEFSFRGIGGGGYDMCRALEEIGVPFIVSHGSGSEYGDGLDVSCGKGLGSFERSLNALGTDFVLRPVIKNGQVTACQDNIKHLENCCRVMREFDALYGHPEDCVVTGLLQ